MNDFILGAIIVCICVGTLYGTVFGWLAFGSFMILSGLISGIKYLFTRNETKDKK